MSAFNLNEQNANIDNKILVGLERLSHVFKILIWEKSKQFDLSPIQIQLLIFIYYHSKDKSTVSYLAKEFNLTKATISDTVKTLLKKELIKKVSNNHDSRSFTLELTNIGVQIVIETESFSNPLLEIIKNIDSNDKIIMWNSIHQLNKSQIISIQRTCYNCEYFSNKKAQSFCNLLNQELSISDIRIDCEEFIMS
jgi:DNA-binding MarR family transcriptional regulator